MLRVLLIVVALTGCVKKAKEAIEGPEPEGGGTLTCKELVETCDAECSDPLCLHRCSPQGNPTGRQLHDALLDCGESAKCTDEACMRASCPNELDACLKHEPQPAQPAEPAPTSGPPGATPSQ